MFGRKKSISIESFFVVILLIAFATSVSVMIIQGGKTFEQIIADKNDSENLRIAMSYISMMIKQNDHSGAINIASDTLQSDGIVIRHGEDEIGYMTYIYFKDGILYECYTDQNTPPTDEISTAIIPLENATFKINEEKNTITITYISKIKGTLKNFNQIVSVKSR